MGRISNREKIIIAECRAAASNDFERVKRGLLPADYEEIAQDYLNASRCIYTEFARQLLQSGSRIVPELVRQFISNNGDLDCDALNCLRLEYVEGNTREQTAELLNVDPVTVYRWINKSASLFGEWLADNLPQKSIDDAARKCATEGKESKLSKFKEYYSIRQQAKRLTAYYKHIPV